MSVWQQHVCPAFEERVPLTLHFQLAQPEEAILYAGLCEFGDEFLAPLNARNPEITHVTVGIFSQPIDQEDEVLKRLRSLEDQLKWLIPCPLFYQYYILDPAAPPLDQPHYSRTLWLVVWSEDPDERHEEVLVAYGSQGMIVSGNFGNIKPDVWRLTLAEPAREIQAHLNG